MFTEEEIKVAKSVRDQIIKEDPLELGSIYMAGEIVMWAEIQVEKKDEAKKAIEFTKEAYVVSSNMPSMLLGDVAELIKITTGVEVDWQLFLKIQNYK